MSKIIIFDCIRLRVKRTTGASWWGTVSVIDSFNPSVTTRHSHSATVNPPGSQSRNETHSNLFKIVAPPGFITWRSRHIQWHGVWRKCWKKSWQKNTSWCLIKTSRGCEIALNVAPTSEKKVSNKDIPMLSWRISETSWHWWSLTSTVLSTATSARTV